MPNSTVTALHPGVPSPGLLRRALGVLLLLLLVSALATCAESHPGEGEAGPPGGGQPPPPEVSVVTLATQTVPLTRELPGRTAPFLVAEVRPQVAGLILQRAFAEGADVAAGELLYQIDPASYEIAVAAARAALQRAEASLANATTTASRIATLADKGVSSTQARDDASGAVRTARAEVAATRAALAAAELDLERTRVLAPIAGRISRSSATRGALVTPYQTTLATVQQLDPIYVDITRPAIEVLRLERAVASGHIDRHDPPVAPVGADAPAAPAVATDAPAVADVTLLLEDGTPYRHPGHLQFTDATVASDTGAVTLRAVFPNPDHELLPGMYVRARLVEGQVHDALLVPQQAVTRDPGGQAVALVVNAAGVVESRVLETDRTLGDQWLVTRGVAAGDRVIVEGLQKAHPGAPATAVPFGPAPAPDAPAPAPAAGAAAPPTASPPSGT